MIPYDVSRLPYSQSFYPPSSVFIWFFSLLLQWYHFTFLVSVVTPDSIFPSVDLELETSIQSIQVVFLGQGYLTQ